MTQPRDDFRPGTQVRLAGTTEIGTTAVADDFWRSLQQRGVAAQDQVLVAWPGKHSVCTWERRDALEIVPGQTAEIPKVTA